MKFEPCFFWSILIMLRHSTFFLLYPVSHKGCLKMVSCSSFSYFFGMEICLMPCPVLVPRMNLKTKWKLFVEPHERQTPHHIGAFWSLFVRNTITWQLYIYVRRNFCFGITYARNRDLAIAALDISVRIRVS